MKPSHDLFELVSSLSKAEKRYVSLFLSTSLHGSNKTSLKLFGAISKMRTYDEEALKKKLGKTFPRISAEKHQLYELIAESMLFYYRDTRVEKQALRARYHSAFLFDKSLRTQAWKYFGKAETLAVKHEMLPVRVMLAYQHNIEARQSFAGEMKFSLDETLEHHRQLTENLRDDLLLHTLFTAIINFSSRYGNVPPTRQAKAELDRIMQHPLMEPAYELHVLTSKITRTEIRAMYFSIVPDLDRARDMYEELVRLMEQSHDYTERLYGLYLNAMTNHFATAVLTGKYDSAEKLGAKLRKALKRIPEFIPADLAYNDLMGVQQYELILYKNRGDNDAGRALLEKAEKNFVRYRPLMRDSLQISFLFLFGTYHYYLGNLKKALAHFNDLIDNTGSGVVQNFHDMVRMIKLLLHYELGHTDLLGSLVSSATRLLTKHGRLGAFEKALLAFFRQLPATGDKKQLHALHELIRRHAPGRYTYGTWCQFDFEAWAESRVSGKTICDLLKC